MTDGALKANAGKVQLHLLPPGPLLDIARVREFGAAKYAAWDWTKGREWTDYYDAVMRHMLAWMAGEDADAESGLPHLAHAACTLMFMLEFAKTGAGVDNRPKGLSHRALPPGGGGSGVPAGMVVRLYTGDDTE